jgi:hypothetical protein
MYDQDSLADRAIENRLTVADVRRITQAVVKAKKRERMLDGMAYRSVTVPIITPQQEVLDFDAETQVREHVQMRLPNV